jgi:hypothetical protein
MAFIELVDNPRDLRKALEKYRSELLLKTEPGKQQ